MQVRDFFSTKKLHIYKILCVYGRFFKQQKNWILYFSVQTIRTLYISEVKTRNHKKKGSRKERIEGGMEWKGKETR